MLIVVLALCFYEPMHYTFNCQECVGKRNILVTQYPLQETVVDFWTMVYDTDSTVVVVLELLNEVCADQCWSFISNPLIVFSKHVMKKIVTNNKR